MSEPPSASLTPADLPFSPAMTRLIGEANSEAGRLQHQYIGTEHLVLALSRHVDGAAPLVALAVDPDRVSQ